MKYYISSKEMDSLFCQHKISQFLSNFANGMKSYLKAWEKYGTSEQFRIFLSVAR